MEVEEVEAVMEKIWDLHDKLSDAIHSLSLSNFLLHHNTNNRRHHDVDVGAAADGGGFVFVKGCCDENAVKEEAKSLRWIRTALENLEDHLHFFHTVQMQQRAERDAAIARLEQSRTILAMRLAEHHGKKYKVIEEALAFVGDVGDASHIISPDIRYDTCLNKKAAGLHGGNMSSVFGRLVSSFNFAKRSFSFECVGGMLGNATLFAFSMITLLHLHQVAHRKEYSHIKDDVIYSSRNVHKGSRLEGSIDGSVRRNHLDVMVARG